MKLDDRQILDVLALARREQALAMMHAENADTLAPGRGRFLPREEPAPARPAQRHVTDFRPA